MQAPSTNALEQRAQRAWQSTARVIDVLAETVVVAALVGELGLVLANVFARTYFHHSFLWADEVARLSLSTSPAPPFWWMADGPRSMGRPRG